MGTDDLPSSPASPDTFEPPDDAVRREMLRMELASLEAEMEGERAALEAELAEETGFEATIVRRAGTRAPRRRIAAPTA